MERIRPYWAYVVHFLSSPALKGVAVILAVPGAIHLQLWGGGLVGFENESSQETGKAELAEEAEVPSSNVEMDSAADSASSKENTSSEFSRRGRVRCPGGGHWLGLERNKRSGTVKFTAPDGTMIIRDTVRVSTISDNEGSHKSVQYEENKSGDLTSAFVNFECDPPNYPGAGGGWMEIELHGEYGPISSSSEAG